MSTQMDDSFAYIDFDFIGGEHFHNAEIFNITATENISQYAY